MYVRMAVAVVVGAWRGYFKIGLYEQQRKNYIAYAARQPGRYEESYEYPGGDCDGDVGF